MTNLQLTALLSLIGSHIAMTLAFILDKGNSDNSFYLMLVGWILGIVSALSNIFLVDKINLNKKLFILFILSSLVWFIPIFLITYFGIPCLLVFLLTSIYVHINSNKRIQKG